MSILGIDFGNESSYLAVIRAGGVDTLDNDYSLRATPSFVAFGEKQRIMGVAAKNQHSTNVENTIYGFKRLIGRSFEDPTIPRQDVDGLPFQLAMTEDGQIGVGVNFSKQLQGFSAVQITAMFFSKLKETAESSMEKIEDCVISCPSYFTNPERKSLLAAAEISGLNVLRLLNDTSAAALCYGVYKKDLPEKGQEPRNVIFVDLGHSALQVFSCSFHRGKFKVTATTCDPALGGRDFSRVLAAHFCGEFKAKYGADPGTNPRAYIRLLTEVEKLRKQMSANSTRLPLNIECLLDDKDFSSSMSRSEFEVLIAPLLQRAERCMMECLTSSDLKKNNIYAVEIVGGASRTPAIKMLIEKVFGKTPSTTLNQDEAVARGCALMCAISSPSLKVKQFSISEIQLYPIVIIYDESDGRAEESEVFPKFHPVPFSINFGIYPEKPFALKAFCKAGGPLRSIGTYEVSNFQAPPEDILRIKAKLKIDINGIFSVASAYTYLKSTAESNPTSLSCPEKEKPEQIELSIKVTSTELPREKIVRLIATEAKLIAQDRTEKERIDARNTLEERVYQWREALDNDLREFLDESMRNRMIEALNHEETWLYNEGSEEDKVSYEKHLETLEDLFQPVAIRRAELSELPSAIECLNLAITDARKVIDGIKNNVPSYTHLQNSEMVMLSQEVDSTAKWTENVWLQIQNAAKHSQLPVPLKEVYDKMDALNAKILPIIHKPIPVVKRQKIASMDIDAAQDLESSIENSIDKSLPTPKAPKKNNSPCMDSN